MSYQGKGGVMTVIMFVLVLTFVSFSCYVIATRRSEAKAKMAPAVDEKKLPQVDHTVSGNESWSLFREMLLNKYLDSVPSDCGECSEEQINYCHTKVISDHCCCDGNKNEVFPWIIHTCYNKTVPCKPIAKDCETYALTRDCCCNNILKEKWSKIRPISPQQVKRSEEPMDMVAVCEAIVGLGLLLIMFLVL